jgi:hypothetical protein
MKIIIAIDDTDNYTSIGTGELLERMVGELSERGWLVAGGVTRHQLPILENIRYTSHNSSMAVSGTSDFSHLREMTDFCKDYIKANAAEGSDPGLCMVVLDSLDDKERLLNYGQRALTQYIEKKEAYDLAERLNGVHLSEHGGEGIGVIGALAGASLRLGGNNGRFKGNFTFPDKPETTVQELLTHPLIEEVRHMVGEQLALTDRILLGEKMKTAYLDGKSILMVDGNRSEGYRTLSRQEMKVF